MAPGGSRSPAGHTASARHLPRGALCVAVLPFENESCDPDSEYLADIACYFSAQCAHGIDPQSSPRRNVRISHRGKGQQHRNRCEGAWIRRADRIQKAGHQSSQRECGKDANHQSAGGWPRPARSPCARCPAVARPVQCEYRSPACDARRNRRPRRRSQWRPAPARVR